MYIMNRQFGFFEGFCIESSLYRNFLAFFIRWLGIKYQEKLILIMGSMGVARLIWPGLSNKPNVFVLQELI